MPGTKTLTDQELVAVVSALSDFTFRDQALVVFLLNTGFRVTEALAANIGDVADGEKVRSRIRLARRQLKGGRGCWRRSVTGRSVPLNAEVTSVLTEYLFQRFGSSGPSDLTSPLFLSRQGGGRLSRWQANRIVHRVLRASGIGEAPRGEFGTHTLRKVFCRQVFEAAGKDIMITKVAMGHQSIETTQRYLSAADDAVDRAVLGLAQIGGSGEFVRPQLPATQRAMIPV